ncbi:DNA topoisomerase 1-like protein [Cinnamomum micranthum f. kanehirae]|uniref:DNA topoisomerase 1-like protein n=1 Tax=Cinnamomum micranthum f. kanehirae TaxID=337451 RepID=A0A443NTF7_9MAGN|nr:DNA topoisomerase 1-like protein [Cinnamomum micranthum f. kanehirae]
MASLVSSQPITLSKAARALSTFLSTETGGSHSLSSYLKRSSSSLDELFYFHRNLKSPKPHSSPSPSPTNHKKIHGNHPITDDDGENHIKDPPLKELRPNLNLDEERGDDLDDGERKIHKEKEKTSGFE